MDEDPRGWELLWFLIFLLPGIALVLGAAKSSPHRIALLMAFAGLIVIPLTARFFKSRKFRRIVVWAGLTFGLGCLLLVHFGII